MIGDCIACTITDRTSYSLTSWESSPLCIPQLYESNIYSPPRRTFCTKEVVNHDLFLLGTQTDFNGSQVHQRPRYPKATNSKWLNQHFRRCSPRKWAIPNNTHQKPPLVSEMPTLGRPSAAAAPCVATIVNQTGGWIPHCADTDLRGQVILVTALLRRCQYSQYKRVILIRLTLFWQQYQWPSDRVLCPP
jgi:hypothetical protein